MCVCMCIDVNKGKTSPSVISNKVRNVLLQYTHFQEVHL